MAAAAAASGKQYAVGRVVKAQGAPISRPTKIKKKMIFQLQ